MTQKETSPAQSSSNKNAKRVSGEHLKKSDADASSSYTVLSDVSGGETDDSEVALFDIRESEGDISGEELVADYDGPEVLDVGDEGIEVLNEEVPDVADAEDGQEEQEVLEVGDAGIEVLNEEVPDVADAEDGQEEQEVLEVSDVGIEVLNEEVPDVADAEEEQKISDAGTGSVDCEVFEEAVWDNGYREADFSTSKDSSLTPFMVGTPPRKTGTPKPWFLHGPDILQKPLCELEIRQRWLTVNVWQKKVFYKYETYGATSVSSEATAPPRKRLTVVEDDNDAPKKRRCCNIQ